MWRSHGRRLPDCASAYCKSAPSRLWRLQLSRSSSASGLSTSFNPRLRGSGVATQDPLPALPSAHQFPSAPSRFWRCSTTEPASPSRSRGFNPRLRGSGVAADIQRRTVAHVRRFNPRLRGSGVAAQRHPEHLDRVVSIRAFAVLALPLSVEEAVAQVRMFQSAPSRFWRCSRTSSPV